MHAGKPRWGLQAIRSSPELWVPGSHEPRSNLSGIGIGVPDGDAGLCMRPGECAPVNIDLNRFGRPLLNARAQTRMNRQQGEIAHLPELAGGLR